MLCKQIFQRSLRRLHQCLRPFTRVWWYLDYEIPCHIVLCQVGNKTSCELVLATLCTIQCHPEEGMGTWVGAYFVEQLLSFFACLQDHLSKIKTQRIRCKAQPKPKVMEEMSNNYPQETVNSNWVLKTLFHLSPFGCAFTYIFMFRYVSRLSRCAFGSCNQHVMVGCPWPTDVIK